MSSVPATSACNPLSPRRLGTRCLITLFIVALCRSNAARCAEQAPPDILVVPNLSPLSLPPSFTILGAIQADERTFSATEFSPRKRGMLGDPAPASQDEAGAPRLGTTTVWQGLKQYRAHDRVQLVTLWESSESSLSLQAGRRGNPSLQWTSKWMNRGGATRGLLDRVVAAAVTGAGAGLRSSAARGLTAAGATAHRPGPSLGPGAGKIP